MKRLYPENPVLDKLYGYTDYRQYLTDYFLAQKKINPRFSHRNLARKAGFTSPSYFLDIVNRKFNLSSRNIPKMIKGVGLRGRAAEFFEVLVRYNQCIDHGKRDLFRKKLDSLRIRSPLYKLNERHIAFTQNWYCQVLREAAVFGNWQGDYGRLGALLQPQVSASEARAAVGVLVELGLIRQHDDGSWEQTSRAISTEDIPAPAKMKARREVMELGIEAVEALPPHDRYVAYTTFSVDREGHDKIIDILEKARRQIFDVVLENTVPERVYEFVLQVFPVSRKLTGEEAADG